jgi:hypothetical protein
VPEDHENCLKSKGRHRKRVEKLSKKKNPVVTPEKFQKTYYRAREFS